MNFQLLWLLIELKRTLIPEFKTLLSMNNFDDIYQNIEENFLAWLDEFQERGSGFVFEEITKTNIRISRTNFLRASSYFPHDLGRRTCFLSQRQQI